MGANLTLPEDAIAYAVTANGEEAGGGLSGRLSLTSTELSGSGELTDVTSGLHLVLETNRPKFIRVRSLILTSDEEVSPEVINYRVSTSRNTQYSDLNTSIEYSSQIAIIRVS
eukprot:2849161-Pyramimonas_sp.AAC.1